MTLMGWLAKPYMGLTALRFISFKPMALKASNDNTSTALPSSIRIFFTSKFAILAVITIGWLSSSITWSESTSENWNDQAGASLAGGGARELMLLVLLHCCSLFLLEIAQSCVAPIMVFIVPAKPSLSSFLWSNASFLGQRQSSTNSLRSPCCVHLYISSFNLMQSLV